MTIKNQALDNNVGKEENAGKQHFLLFPQCFLLYQKESFSFQQPLICHLQMLSVCSCPKFCHGTVETHEYVNCCHNMTKVVLKHHSVNALPHNPDF